MTEQTLTPAESLQASISTLEGLAETRRQISILQAEINRLTLMLEYKQPRLELAQIAISYAIVLNERTSTYSELIQYVDEIIQLNPPENLEEYNYAILFNLFDLLFYLRQNFGNRDAFNSLLSTSSELRDNLTRLQALLQLDTITVFNNMALFVTNQVVNLISYLSFNQRIINTYSNLINQLSGFHYPNPYLISLVDVLTQSSQLLIELIELSEATFIDNNYLHGIEEIMSILYPYTPDWEPPFIQNSPPLELNNMYIFAVKEESNRLDLIKDFHALVNEITTGMDEQLNHAYNQVLLAIAYTISE